MSKFQYNNPADGGTCCYTGIMVGPNYNFWMKWIAPQTGILQQIGYQIGASNDWNTGSGNTGGPIQLSLYALSDDESTATLIGSSQSGFLLPVGMQMVDIPMVGVDNSGNVTPSPPHITAGSKYRTMVQWTPSYSGTNLQWRLYGYQNDTNPAKVSYNTIPSSYAYRCNVTEVMNSFSGSSSNPYFPNMELVVYRDGSQQGGWGAWSAWGDCSTTCGGGTQTSTRQCDNPVPQLDGTCPPGSQIQTQSCNTNPCPQDGGWTSYQWGQCSNSCGDGVQVGTRTCTNPTPQYGGQQCVGDSQSTQDCNLGPCPIAGGWTDWSDWSQCSADCGGGTQSSTRTCTNPAPQYGGQDCVGDSTQTRPCNTDPCPQDGGWTDWSDWQACSADCGGGLQLRTRTCNNPVPQNGGQQCVGDDTDIQACNTDACPVPGGWSTYTFGECSATCGGGTQTGTRVCNNPAPVGTGAQCVGDSTITQTCNTQACTVPGGWSDYTWTDCSEVCGGGTQTGTRVCNNPAPQNGGQQCSGSSTITQTCNTQPCAPTPTTTVPVTTSTAPPSNTVFGVSSTILIMIFILVVMIGVYMSITTATTTANVITH